MRRSVRLCTTHSIDAKVLETIVLDAIRTISRYAIENPDEFRKKVLELCSARQKDEAKESEDRLSRLNKRQDELNMLIRKLYESYAFSVIPEDQFNQMMRAYADELSELKPEIEAAEKEVKTNCEDDQRAE